MSLTKMVDGVPVVCSLEEEADILSFWASNDPAKKPVSVPSKPVDAIINDPEQMSALKAALLKS